MPAQKPASRTSSDGVFLDVVNDDPLRPDAPVALQHVENQPRAFQFVLQVRRVDQNQLVVPRRQIHVHFEHFQFVP